MRLADVPQDKRFLWYFDPDLNSDLVWIEYYTGQGIQLTGILFDRPRGLNNYPDQYYLNYANAFNNLFNQNELLLFPLISLNFFPDEEIIIDAGNPQESAKLTYYSYQNLPELEILEIIEDLGDHISNQNQLEQTYYFAPYNYINDYQRITATEYYTDLIQNNNNLTNVVIRAELKTKYIRYKTTEQRIKLSELEPLERIRLGFDPLFLNSCIAEGNVSLPNFFEYSIGNDLETNARTETIILNQETHYSEVELSGFPTDGREFNCQYLKDNFTTENFLTEDLQSHLAIKTLSPDVENNDVGYPLAHPNIRNFFNQYGSNGFSNLWQYIEGTPTREEFYSDTGNIRFLYNYWLCFTFGEGSRTTIKFFNTEIRTLSYTSVANTIPPPPQYVSSIKEVTEIDQSSGLAWFFSDDNRSNILSIIESSNYPDYYQAKDIFYQELETMGIVQMIEEIHACLGATDYAFHNGSPYYMHVARRLDWLATAYGVAFKPNGEVKAVPQRINLKHEFNPNTGSSSITIPDGYLRGQFADTDDFIEEQLGVAYLNRCNEYENYDDTDPTNNIYRQGDIVLCHNMLQFWESFLEDLDKGLNWQEMGAGVLPSPDGTRFCTINGLGTLVAENAFMIASLSKNIYETHVLALKSYHCVLQLIQGLGIPITNTQLEIVLPEGDESDPTRAYANVPSITEDAPNLTQQMNNILTNIAIILGATSTDYKI